MTFRSSIIEISSRALTDALPRLWLFATTKIFSALEAVGTLERDRELYQHCPEHSLVRNRVEACFGIRFSQSHHFYLYISKRRKDVI